MKRILIFLAALTAGFPGASGAESADVEWLLEDALEEDMIHIAVSEIAGPEKLRNALEAYRNGSFRRAAEKLEQIAGLHLPDGRADFIALMLGECYRKLDLERLAVERFSFVVDRFAASANAPAAYFRLLQYAYERRDNGAADSLLRTFQTSYQSHPLYNSVLYVTGKLYYRTERYGEAVEIMRQIPKRSSRYAQAQFLSALCSIRLKNADAALKRLAAVRASSTDRRLLSEADMVAGDIFMTRDDVRTALKYYQSVPKDAPRYHHSLVKIARMYLDMEELEKARKVARNFIDTYPRSDYFFEMASVLEQVYTRTGDKAGAARISNMVYRQIIDARMAFELSNELTSAYDMVRRLKKVGFEAEARGLRSLEKSCEKDLARLQAFMRKCREALAEIGAIDRHDKEVAGLAERRYLASLRQTIQATEDTLLSRQFALEDARREIGEAATDDSVPALRKEVDSLHQRLALLHAEFDELLHSTTDIGRIGERFNNEMQAKFIDFAFMRYLDKKKELVAMNVEMANRAKQEDTGADSLSSRGKNVTNMFAAIDRDKLRESIKRERTELIDHIQTLLEGSSRTRHHPQILFRLAELFYDRATDQFDVALRAYEKQMAQGVDSGALEFPEYDLGPVIRVYDQIMREYPNDWVADDACFYKAMAQRKMGNEERANNILIELTERYPESEYFVEANMNIGRYFFEHPKTKNGQGYRLAEEAFRKVLYYRDHPQFVEALYHLGWCYYMQDHFDEAIAVFKYLVEAVELDFDPVRADEKLVVNPLLREEAIDYIAISFDEEGNIEEAITFLELIGNDDYSALVLKRIGELREEDLDYAKAIAIYNRLLEKYPHSVASPKAAVSLMKLYAMQNNTVAGMRAREDFFQRYARGGDWQKRARAIDSAEVVKVDSMAISIGLYVADELYRNAEHTMNDTLYRRAADNYRKVVSAYPDHSRAAEARWNLAVILDTRLSRPQSAYREFIAYSRIGQADPERRKQAALNAIAIAQRLAAEDAVLTKGVVGPAAEKMLEAAENYSKLFPDGRELSDIALSIGSYYFNRDMFTEAADAYQQITVRGEGYPKFYEARFMIGKCLFGREKWIPAAAAFDDVWRRSPDWSQRDEAYKLLLQAKFLYAKGLFESGAYEKAAIAYESIEKEYPGSEYGDVALFNAAESYEKLENWQKATKSYHALYKKYPQSKFAPDALFNAASDYEKAQKFDKAAEVYEIIGAEYPDSDKAKDALFNIGFCYEKMGKLEKMAEANERYTLRYPGEKDVEAMLLRSARFYFNAGMFDRALSAFRNFVRRFPASPMTVEALFMIGKSQLSQQDAYNAALSFAQAEQQNAKLKESGGEANDFYAAEAAFALAQLKRDDFLKVGFDVEQERMKETQKQKTELLAEAAKGYQRVIQYRSERMLEAAFRIGELYEIFAAHWREQQRFEKDPVKAALAEKDINLVCATLTRKSFEPYSKVIELTAKIDSLSADQKLWSDSSKARLAQGFVTAGEFMSEAIAAMHNAPVPREIQSKPLFYYQYLKQLLETIEPMKVKARDYYYTAHLELDAYGFATLQSETCRDRFARLAFKIPNDYDFLGEKILRGAEDLPHDLSEAEREELIFQFEDIVFELQDKAIFGYEDALALLRDRGITQSRWYSKIIERLAVLNPDMYGKRFYLTVPAGSGSDWFARSDSVAEWNTVKAPLEGWRQAEAVSPRPIRLGEGQAHLIWGDRQAARVFLWKPLFLNGEPRAASVHLAAKGAYALYVNGTLVMTDSAEGAAVDSINDVASLLRGGDNVLALDITATDSLKKGAAVYMHALIDTTRHFARAMELPAVARRRESPDTAVAEAPLEQAAAETAEADSIAAAPNRAAVLESITAYQQRTRETGLAIKRERLNLQKLAIRERDLDEKIEAIRKEIERLKEGGPSGRESSVLRTLDKRSSARESIPADSAGRTSIAPLDARAEPAREASETQPPVGRFAPRDSSALNADPAEPASASRIDQAEKNAEIEADITAP